MTFEPLLTASPAIQIHVAAAIAAFALGGWVLFKPKGGPRHRLAGRLWVALMLVVALSSFFIHAIRLWGPWSPIHLISLGTLVSLAYGVQMARIRKIAAHQRTMQATYLGGLVIAGGFTFLPGRIMFEVMFGGPSAWPGVALGLAIVATSVGLTAWRLWPQAAGRITGARLAHR